MDLRLPAVAALLAFSPVARAGDKVAKAADFADRAMAARDAGDWSAALKAATKAIKLDETNADAHFELASVFDHMAGVDDPKLAEMFSTLATRAYERVVALAPDSLIGGIAKDALGGGLQVPARPVTCPADAVAAADEAEKAFGAHDYDAAAGHYARASAACPDNPVWWTWAGDVPFGKGDYAGARALYEKAIAVAPCHAPAWRYEADALMREGKAKEAWDAAVRGAACDPSYDAGWAMLADFARAGDHRLDPHLRLDAPLPGVDPAAVEAIYEAYQHGVARLDRSPFEQKRASVGAALVKWAELGTPEIPLWRALGNAYAAGHLDAAIYLLLMDQEMVPEFVAWRDAHVEELAGFVQGAMIVPLE